MLPKNLDLCTSIALLHFSFVPAYADVDPLSVLKGSVMVHIADGDFAASTYVDGKLAPEDGRLDLLSVTKLGDPSQGSGQVNASNSVTATPESVALSSDGSYAYVIDRLGPRPEEATTAQDLPPGQTLTIVSLADHMTPRITATVPLAAFPESVRISPDGRFVAVPSNTADEAILQIIPVADGNAGQVTTLRLSDLGIRGEGDGPRGGVTATFIDWHPSGQAIAVNLNTMDEVAFFRVAAQENGAVSLSPWGAPVQVGRDPFVGRFTPDGNHYITVDWGRDFTASSLFDRLPENPSKVSVVRLGTIDQGAGAKHLKVSEAETDRSSEGLAISPDGRLIATVNMRETAFPAGHQRHTRDASVTLLRFDPKTGLIEKLGDTLFEGILPEGASFDATGDHLIVTSYAYPDDPHGPSGLEVFRVQDDSRIQHVGRIPAPPGTHHVEIR